MELSIVSSHYNEDLSWLHQANYPVFVVSKEGGKHVIEKNFFKFHKIPNRGSEFGSYLWFICNYWDSLPEKTAFIHGHEFSRHQCIPILSAIDLFKEKDFHGLNGPRVIAYHYFFEDVPNPWFRDPLNIWNHIGLNKVLCMPKQFVFQGGTQTIVSRDLIKFYPKHFYEHMLNRIMSASQQESWYIGLFLELVWHVMFQQNPINFELLDKQINNYCIQNRLSIVLLGKDKVWGSSFRHVVRFQECKDYNEWYDSCRQIIFNKDLWSNNIVV